MPQIRFDGACSQYIYFAAKSRSRAGLWHDLWIEKHGKDKGTIRCSCEHCQHRHLRSHIFDPGSGCRHCDWLDEIIDEILCGLHDENEAA